MPQDVLIRLIRERTKTRGRRQHDYVMKGKWLEDEKRLYTYYNDPR